MNNNESIFLSELNLASIITMLTNVAV